MMVTGTVAGERAAGGSLWRQRDFLVLWAGQTVSLFGSRVTMLALPLTAIVTLHAGAFEVGLLEAVGAAGLPVFGLAAGVWVDRLRRRPVMLAANLGQAVLLASIPVASWLGVLGLPQIYLVSFGAASLAVFFRTAYRAYLPSLVPYERLVEGNSRLAMSGSAAQIGGPGIGGALVQMVGAPMAVLVDAVSFLLAAGSLLVIRSREDARPQVEEGSMIREAIKGVRVVAGNQILRALAGASAIFNLFDSVLLAVYILYMSRTLGLAAGMIGVVFGLAGSGGILGALTVAPLTGRIGLRRAIILGVTLAAGGEMLIAGAGGGPLTAVLVLLAAEALVELGASLYSINAASIQQVMTPDALRGRVSATDDLIGFGMAPLGALLGGVLGQSVGLRETVLIAGAGTLLSVVWLVTSAMHFPESSSR